MFFSWWKNRRRHKILTEPFPAAWEAILRDIVRHDAVIPEPHRAKLRQAVKIIVAEKTWEGCRGLEIMDEMRVVISALAGILTLGMDDYYFDNVQTILVYPNIYIVTEEKGLAGDLALHEESERLGEAHVHGPILLAWDEVRDNALRPGVGQNLVFHEFAHQLDYLNGAMDGTPSLASADLAQRWGKIMDREYRALVRADDEERETLIDPYGASSPAEFFAVTTECFFDSPQPMRKEHPDLYALFRDYYRQDPAAWGMF